MRKRCVHSRIGFALSIAAGLSTTACQIHAQSFPSRTVRMVVPVAPGGASDTLARMLAVGLTEKWGHAMVTDNRPGAGTVIGTEMVARATPDGHTLLLVSIAHASNASLVKNLPYDPAKDFSAVTIVATAPQIVLVHPSLNAESLKDLITMAKARPGKPNYSSAGNGTGAHLAAELLKSMASIDVVHIPYKSGGQSVLAVLGNQVQVSFSSIVPAVPHVKSGRLRALAVTSIKRSVAVPDVPTVAEAAVPGYDGNTWNGVVAPAGTPPSVLRKLAADIAEVLNAPDIKDKLLAQGLEPELRSPAQSDQFIRDEIVK